VHHADFAKVVAPLIFLMVQLLLPVLVKNDNEIYNDI
jgi:hypothetical protein